MFLTKNMSIKRSLLPLSIFSAVLLFSISFTPLSSRFFDVTSFQRVPVTPLNAFPPPLSTIYTPPSSVPLFTTPHVIQTFYDHSTSTLHVFTAGIHMSRSQRGLNGVGCVVDDVLYHSHVSRDDVLMCHTPPVSPGTNITVVLLRDEALREAERGPIKLVTDVIATLDPSDLIPLPPHINQTTNEYPRNELRLVTHPRESLKKDSIIPYRWRFCLMTQTVAYTWILPQWVSYHRRVGIDHVYIFDNGAKENITAMFTERSDVEVISWPFHKSQPQLVGWFLLVARSRCQYVLHMDVDEFLLMGLGTEFEYKEATPLSAAIVDRLDQSKLLNFKFTYITMQNQGYRLNPHGFLAERYTQIATKQYFANGKSMCSTVPNYESGLVHGCGKINSKSVPFYKTAVTKWADVSMRPTRRGDIPFVVHFRQRSWEEWVTKGNIGFVSGALVADAGKGMLSVDEPEDWYMKVNGKIYTHFRDVWRRVMEEGKRWESFAVMTKRNSTSSCRLVNVDSGKVVSKLVGEGCE